MVASSSWKWEDARRVKLYDRVWDRRTKEMVVHI
jgi:hypothetical protein